MTIRRIAVAVLVMATVVLAVAADVETEPNSGDEYRETRLHMVEQYLARQGITNPRVLDAVRAVPRHRFVPEREQAFAYENRPLPIGHGQTISQPYIVGYMTQELNLRSSDTVLEVGTGSGYQAAILAQLCDHVFSVEILPVLAQRSAALLDELGYGVETKVGDGYFGWEEHAPYDAIIVTAAADHVPPPLVEQLKPGGTMIIPVGSINQVQSLLLIRKSENGRVSRDALLAVRFVPLTGER